MKKLEERIALVKQATGWSNAELARQAGVSRTAPTDWLSGRVGVLSSKVAQNLSIRSPFTVNWLATGDQPILKAGTDGAAHSDWPFTTLDEQKIRELQPDEILKLEGAFLAAAGFVGIDVKKRS